MRPLFDLKSRLSIYAVITPFLIKEVSRKYNSSSGMRKLDENDVDLPESLEGKVCVITGGSRGIGAEVVKTLLKKGCHVITGSSAKNQTEIEKRYRAIIEEVSEVKGKLEIWNLDLMSMSSVIQFVERFKNSNLSLNYLIANAGIMLQDYKETKDGFESHYQINYLSHCLLIFHLLPNLVETARQANSSESRIVLVSSCAHFAANIRFHDLQLKYLYSRYFAYSQSKLAQVMFTYKLSRWLNSKSDWGQLVKVHALHPGMCNTDLFDVIEFVRDYPQLAEMSTFRVCLILNIYNFFCITLNLKSNYFILNFLLILYLNSRDIHILREINKRNHR
jgi:NAD(P)-dependent dehydrogenase (short-subunit alcohol dehydrogenase family)